MFEHSDSTCNWHVLHIYAMDFGSLTSLSAGGFNGPKDLEQQDRKIGGSVGDDFLKVNFLSFSSCPAEHS